MKIFVTNDPLEMELAREHSWLARIFQKYNLSAEEKQLVLKSLIQDHKDKLKEVDK